MTNEMHDNDDRGDLPPLRLDFGDADVVPADDPAFDAWIAKVAPTLNTPQNAPRLEMWKSIQGRRADRVPGVTRLRRPPWRLMSVIAAALLLGVAIDRFALRPAGTATRPDASVAAAPPAGDANDPGRLYRLAATQTLTQAEALLTAYRATDTTSRNAADARQLGRWGRDVLGSTRLLLDSPAGDDPQLRSLLGDLELVLVQIIQISGAPLDPADRSLIERALEERDLLPRIRTVVPASVGAASSDD